MSPRTIFLALLPLLATPFFAHAACSGLPVQAYANPVNVAGVEICDIPSLFLALVELVLLIGTPLVVIFLIYAGFLFVTARDNEAAVSKAKTVFMWTVVGALLLFGAKALSLGIKETLTSLGGPTG